MNRGHDTDCDCFRCHIESVGIAPSAMPTRHNSKAPARLNENNNSWERGIAVHKPSGMPYLDAQLDTIGLHEWQSTRHKYEAEFNAQTAGKTGVTQEP